MPAHRRIAPGVEAPGVEIGGLDHVRLEELPPALADSHRQILFDYVGNGQFDLTTFDARRCASLGGYAQDIFEVCDA